MAKETKDEEKKLPKRKPTALKRRIQDEKKHLRNRTAKRKIQTVKAKLENETTSEGKAPILNDLYSLLDKAVKSNVIKKGKASRIKSRYAAKI